MQTISPPSWGGVNARSGKADKSDISSPPEQRQKPHIQSGWGCYGRNYIQSINSFRPGLNTCND